MKFEYEFNYDFVSKEIVFKITKMPESLRGNKDIITIDSDTGKTWFIKSFLHPEIIVISNSIYLRGNWEKRDTDTVTAKVTSSDAAEVANVLEKLQMWIENYNEEVEMTVAEIEKKLGIKNLKIVKENK